MSKIRKSYHKKSIKSSRRQYNQWVANETLEDYSLRYTPKSYRKWPELLIANTAIGSISFLALEAIGASIALHYGFATAFWAILTASVIIFLTAIPISYHAARYNIDIDLITRSAGFGYIGSTITSLIYASFCFIFFALEAAILAQALFLFFGLPLPWGYLLSSLVIIPMVFYGVTFINKLQLWTQPIWAIMMVAPFALVLYKEPGAIDALFDLKGSESQSSEFNGYYFGFALGISLSLIAQIGEQVDYIRFMPPLREHNKVKWWVSMLIAGPGWIILGFLKQIGGIFLAAIVLLAGFSVYEAKTPIQMYTVGYQYVFDNPATALAASTLFVVISQIKINVTNAYAGSLAWSNFFSRVTHTHPGRVVWMVFNIFIALLLMELGVFDVLEKVLGLYSNVAIAWIGAMVSDLTINKPCGLSPKIIEFKRAYLHNFNPVGIASMGIASFISILAFTGIFGDYAQSYSSLIALTLAFLLAPFFAWFTKGKYYIARNNEIKSSGDTHVTCGVCDTTYEYQDMAHCPFHQMNICSLCCSLESLCHDVCKSENDRGFRHKLALIINKLLAEKISIKASRRLLNFVAISGLLFFVVAIIGWMIFSMHAEKMPPGGVAFLKDALTQFFILSVIIMSMIAWWIILLQESRQLAENDLEEQNTALEDEIKVRKKAETKAHTLANYDTLTNLANRHLLNNHLKQAILQSERLNKRFSLLFLDLDGFKPVNDSLGHNAGDELLKLIAKRLIGSVRKSDLVARIGGDEFVVLLQHIKSVNEVSHVAQNILRVMEVPFSVAGHTIHNSFSIGISTYPEDGTDISSLLKNADIAMYNVKNKNKNSFMFFNQAMNKEVISRMLIEQELRIAINENQLFLDYQPQMEQGKIVCLEALVRWQHPERDLLYPIKFISIAEQNDVILKLGYWVLHQTCQQINLWQQEGLNPVPVSVNISQMQLAQDDFVDNIQQILKIYKLQPHQLELELSEISAMDQSEQAIKQLHALSKMGLKLAIDNFGSGFSSLSHLKTLPISKLKIDISFIENLSDNQTDQALVKTIINLAQNLNFDIQAEGVETKEQWAFLQQNNVNLVQGFLFHKPMSAAQISGLLNNN